MKQLENIKSQLTSIVEGQMSNLQSTDAKELGEAIDMIKDLSEAIYYCTITEAMKEQPAEKNYYTEPKYRYMPLKEKYIGMDEGYHDGRMYYTENNVRNPMGRTNNDDRSYETRKMYMRSKELHQDKTIKMQELEQYMKQLTSELVDMIEDSSPEEKQLLQQKLATLTKKIEQVNV